MAVRSLQTVEEYERLIKGERFKVTTDEHKSVFFSGRYADEFKQKLFTYTKMTAAFGFTTLEQTLGGRWLNNQQLHKELVSPDGYLIGKPSWKALSESEVNSIWDFASKKYAEQAQGEVVVVCLDAKPTSTFQREELPALLKNENVTLLNGISRQELFAKYPASHDQNKQQQTIHEMTQMLGRRAKQYENFMEQQLRQQQEQNHAIEQQRPAYQHARTH